MATKRSTLLGTYTTMHWVYEITVIGRSQLLMEASSSSQLVTDHLVIGLEPGSVNTIKVAPHTRKL